MLISVIGLLILAGLLVSARVVRELGFLRRYDEDALSDEDE